MHSEQMLVTIAALIAGSICFLLYVYATIAGIRARTIALGQGTSAPSDGAFAARGITVEDAGRLADALARLADSLSRASPALTSLIGALAFFAIAAISSGALHS